MMDQSIVLTSYNRLWSLPKAVESCRGSRYETEIIVCDDGSTDGTWEWLQEQPDVVAVRAPGWGQNWAINTGIEHARGRYVRFLDSDDWILPGTLDRHMALAEETGVDIVVGATEVRAEEGELLSLERPPETDDFLLIYLRNYPCPHYTSHLYRREFIADDRFLQPFAAADFAISEDLGYMLNLGLKNPRIAISREPATVFLQHGRGRQMYQPGIRSVGAILQFMSIYKRTISRLIDRNELTPERAAVAAAFLWKLADWTARKGFLNDAEEMVRWIRRIAPDSRPEYTPRVQALVDALGFRRAMRLLYIGRTVRGWLMPWKRPARPPFRYPLPKSKPLGAAPDEEPREAGVAKRPAET